jgi:hypothetical protein
MLAAGCTGGGPSGTALSAKTNAAKIVKGWRIDIQTAAPAYPRNRFSNPSRARLVAQLRHAAARYHFQVVKIEILHHLRQSAPLVVIQTKDKSALSSSTFAILKLIDPRANTNDPRTGWAYEGFLFEALDSHRVPFLIADNYYWRGTQVGEQWASDRSLYPFMVL